MFKEPFTEEDKKVLEEVIKPLKEAAEKAKDIGRCIEGEAIFWHEYHRALAPGHIYSEAGRNEFRISRLCEYHFDSVTDPSVVDDAMERYFDADQ